MLKPDKTVVTKTGKSKTGSNYSIRVYVVDASCDGVAVSSGIVAETIASVIEGAMKPEKKTTG